MFWANHSKISVNSYLTENFFTRKPVKFRYFIQCAVSTINSGLIFFRQELAVILQFFEQRPGKELQTLNRLNLFSKFHFLGQGIFFLSSELPLTLCACHGISSIFKLLCPFLQCLLFAMFIFRK